LQFNLLFIFYETLSFYCKITAAFFLLTYLFMD
jgi:hypothetical protein